MRYGHRVAWTKGSRVYHWRSRARTTMRGFPDKLGMIVEEDVVVAPCGAILWCTRWRASEGTEGEAIRLGYRSCLRCWPLDIRPYPTQPEESAQIAF